MIKHTMKYLLIYSGIISVLGGVSVKANEERPTYQLEEVVVTATATPVKKTRYICKCSNYYAR